MTMDTVLTVGDLLTLGIYAVVGYTIGAIVFSLISDFITGYMRSHE